MRNSHTHPFTLQDPKPYPEQELYILAHEADNENRFPDHHSAQATTALLESDELIDMALNSWRNWLEGQAGNGTSANGYMNSGAFVPDLVEVLFDLVPALRAARRTYCVCLAENGAREETSAEGPAADNSTASASATLLRNHMERKLDAEGEMLGRRDDMITKKGKDVGLYSRIFQRQKDI